MLLYIVLTCLFLWNNKLTFILRMVYLSVSSWKGTHINDTVFTIYTSSVTYPIVSDWNSLFSNRFVLYSQLIQSKQIWDQARGTIQNNHWNKDVSGHNGVMQQHTDFQVLPSDLKINGLERLLLKTSSGNHPPFSLPIRNCKGRQNTGISVEGCAGLSSP